MQSGNSYKYTKDPNISNNDAAVIGPFNFIMLIVALYNRLFSSYLNSGLLVLRYANML